MAHLAQALALERIVLVRPKFIFSHRAFMKVTITTLSGVEVAHLDVDATLLLGDVLALLPSQAGGIECSRRLFSGRTELVGSMSLSDIGVKEGSILALVCVVMLRVLTASYDGTAKVWSAVSGDCLLTLRGHGDVVTTAVFSADDQQVLTASKDRTAKVWSSTSGECLLTLRGHGRWVNTAVFCDDGQQVLTASDDRTAKVWSAASGECLITLQGHGCDVNSAVFSADDRRVLTASADGTTKVWSAAPESACSH